MIYFYILIIIIGLIISILNFIPSPLPNYTSLFSYLVIEILTPLINNLIGWIFQQFGLDNLMGNGNTFLAQFGLSNTNINALSLALGVIFLIYSIVILSGIYYFKKSRKIGWIFLFITSIPLIIFIIGIFFLNYLSRKNVIDHYWKF
ncbi:MAG: hypothetical protein ACTSYZ_09865 [Candidatus Helarchaeota archaeon]